MADNGIETNEFGYKDVIAAENVPQIPVTVSSGSGVLSRGTVMGRVTASQELVPWAPGASDGSQNIAGVLAADIDATLADVKTSAYVNGPFRYDGLTFAGTPTGAQKCAAFAAAKMHVDKNLVAVLAG